MCSCAATRHRGNDGDQARGGDLCPQGGKADRAGPDGAGSGHKKQHSWGSRKGQTLGEGTKKAAQEALGEARQGARRGPQAPAASSPISRPSALFSLQLPK